MGHTLNSVIGAYTGSDTGDFWGITIELIKGDTRSGDYSSHGSNHPQIYVKIS